MLKSDIKAVSLANVSTRVGSIPEDVSANYVGVVAGGVARGAGQRRVGRGGMWRGARRQDGVGKRSYEGYSGVGRGGGGLRGQGGVGRGGGGLSESVQQSPSTKTSAVPRRTSGEPFHREKVVGARRVWGTLSMCTTGAVHSAIKRFCGIESVRVKRKSRIMPNGNHQWWFVIHDDESVLSDLDTKWNLVQVQTSWKLECCYKPSVPLQQADNINVSTVNKDMSHSIVELNCATTVIQEPPQGLDNDKDNSEMLSSTVQQITPHDVPDCVSAITPDTCPIVSDSPN